MSDEPHHCIYREKLDDAARLLGGFHHYHGELHAIGGKEVADMLDGSLYSMTDAFLKSLHNQNIGRPPTAVYEKAISTIHEMLVGSATRVEMLRALFQLGVIEMEEQP